MKVNIARSQKKHKQFGKFSRITFSDGSQIYVTKKGWTMVLAKSKFKINIEKAKKLGKIEITVPYHKINVALQESLVLGYTEKCKVEDRSVTNGNK